MRSLLIFAAACSLGFLFWRLLHVRVPLAQLLYVGYVILCTITAPIVLQYTQTHKKDFAVFFAVTMVPAAFMAGRMAVRWAAPLYYAAELIIAVLTVSAVLALNAHHYAPKHFAVDVIIAQGFFFLCAGVLTICSMLHPTSALDLRLRTAYGLYWGFIGAYSFIASIWIARSFALFRSMNDGLQMAACIVFAVSLGVALWSLQTEGGRQEIRGMQIAQVEYEQ